MFKYDDKQGAYISKSLFGNIKRDSQLSFSEINDMNKQLNLTTLTEQDMNMLQNLANAMGYNGNNFKNDKLNKIYNLPNNKLSLSNLIKLGVQYRDTKSMEYSKLPNIDIAKVSNLDILFMLCLFNIIMIILLY